MVVGGPGVPGGLTSCAQALGGSSPGWGTLEKGKSEWSTFKLKPQSEIGPYGSFHKYNAHSEGVSSRLI